MTVVGKKRKKKERRDGGRFQKHACEKIACGNVQCCCCFLIIMLHVRCTVDAVSNNTKATLVEQQQGTVWIYHPYRRKKNDAEIFLKHFRD